MSYFVERMKEVGDFLQKTASHSVEHYSAGEGKGLTQETEITDFYRTALELGKDLSSGKWNKKSVEELLNREVSAQIKQCFGRNRANLEELKGKITSEIYQPLGNVLSQLSSGNFDSDEVLSTVNKIQASAIVTSNMGPLSIVIPNYVKEQLEQLCSIKDNMASAKSLKQMRHCVEENFAGLTSYESKIDKESEWFSTLEEGELSRVKQISSDLEDLISSDS